jgi:hypothetical protein
MENILDDFGQKQPTGNKIKLYVLYAIGVLLLINGFAYMDSKEYIEVIPIFDRRAGLTAMFLLFSVTIIWCHLAVRTHFVLSILMGSFITLLAFTIDYNIIITILDTHKPANPFPFWGYISMGYISLSIVLITFLDRIYSRYRKRNRKKGKE